MKTITLIFSLAMVACLFAGPVENLKPGEWYMVPNSHMDALDPCPQRNCPYSMVEGISAVMNDWAGGLFDSDSNRLVVTGGGHSGYAGNELYAFDMNQLKWLRLTNPSPVSDLNVCQEPNPDSTPRARHNYNGLEYISHAKRLFEFGGDMAYMPGGCGSSLLWTFDAKMLKWRNMRPTGTTPSGDKGASCAYDPVSGKVYFCDNSGWSSYDYDNNRWTHLNSDIYYYQRQSVVDPKRRLIVSTGGAAANTATFNLNTSGLTKQVLATTGDLTIQNSGSPTGLAYDPVTEKIIGWDGGASVYTLDVDTKVWTKVAPASTNTVTPTARNSNGTYGRFRYVPAMNAFVVVNQVNENVYIYRLTADAAAPQWYLDMIGLGTSVETKVARKAAFSVSAAPNPFRQSIKIDIAGLSGAAGAQVKVFDLRGRVVADLSDALKERNGAGLEWDAGLLNAGVYLVRVTHQGKTFVKSLVCER